MRGYRELTADDNAEDWLDYYCGWKVSNQPEVLEAAARAAAEAAARVAEVAAMEIEPGWKWGD